MKNEGKTALAHLTASAEKEFCAFLTQQTPEAYEDAVALIEECRAAGHRVHVTGIGKPGHVAGYGASLLSSTGTPSYFLHGTEAVHGSCGQLEEGDVVIAISNSGETVELKATVLAVKNNGCRVIGITGNAESWLAKESDALLLAQNIVGKRARLAVIEIEIGAGHRRINPFSMQIGDLNLRTFLA